MATVGRETTFESDAHGSAGAPEVPGAVAGAEGLDDGKGDGDSSGEAAGDGVTGGCTNAATDGVGRRAATSAASKIGTDSKRRNEIDGNLQRRIPISFRRSSTRPPGCPRS